MKERRSPTPAAHRKRDAIRRLEAALREDRIVLHYQPIASASDLRVDRVEALLRWRTPAAGDESLTDLIVQAERSPVIFKIENWILARAFQDAAAWRKAGLSGLRTQVNLSAREFPRADLVRRVTRFLESAGLQPRHVSLEITETSSMRDFEDVAEQIQQLNDMGIELWLDDFGTGHSSLEWLSHLPLHGVKIPGTFVERLFTEPRCQTIVARVIDLAHDLGLWVIAEEVETTEQRELLLAKGCDLMQGYLLYPALPGPELAAAVAAAGAVPR